LATLAQSLLASDRVALEVTGSCWEVARLLEAHVDRVIVVSPDDTGITQARAKTDRLDARALAMLLWRGELEAVWMPDESCRVLRRRLARRQQLIWARTRSKNEIHAVLARRLQAKPPCADLFGVKGRAWLEGLTLPIEERESVDAGVRHIAFLDSEIAAVDRAIARQALDWPEIRRLMTVTGVNVVCAATFMAAIEHLLHGDLVDVVVDHPGRECVSEPIRGHVRPGVVLLADVADACPALHPADQRLVRKRVSSVGVRALVGNTWLHPAGNVSPAAAPGGGGRCPSALGAGLRVSRGQRWRIAVRVGLRELPRSVASRRCLKQVDFD
jgi:transposase